jgi:hypothetical protein
VSDTPSGLPSFTSWPTFPFEGEFRVKQLDEPVSVEPPRHGEDPADCRACSAPDEAYIWVSERWRVRSLDRPTGLPVVVILESRSHLDMGDLPNFLAAELGVMTVRLERAVRSLDGVARVHVTRWGDGSAHLHVWFMARPYGRLQLRGTFLSLWDEILPPISEWQWQENLALVAAWLGEFGGQALAEPPRIDWQAPALFASPTVTNDDEATEAPESTEPAVAAVAFEERVDDADHEAGSGKRDEAREGPVGGSVGGEPETVVPGQRDGAAGEGQASTAVMSTVVLEADPDDEDGVTEAGNDADADGGEAGRDSQRNRHRQRIKRR